MNDGQRLDAIEQIIAKSGQESIGHDKRHGKDVLVMKEDLDDWLDRMDVA